MQAEQETFIKERWELQSFQYQVWFLIVFIERSFIHGYKVEKVLHKGSISINK